MKVTNKPKTKRAWQREPREFDVEREVQHLTFDDLKGLDAKAFEACIEAHEHYNS